MNPNPVITGIGVTSALGMEVGQFWQSLLTGRSAIGPVTRFDVSGYHSRLAGEIQGFDATEHLPGRLMPQTDPSTRLALVAADRAFLDAGIVVRAPGSAQMGVVTSAAGGGYEFGQRELAKLHSQGPSFVSAYQSFAWFYAVNTGQISIRNGLRGPGSVIISDQAGGLDAFAQVRRQIASGTPVVVTGGADSPLCPWAWVSHQSTGLMSTVRDPQRAYLPFDTDASGYVAGEGGAIMIVESSERVNEADRDVSVYGRVAGQASTFEAGRPGRPPAMRRAIENALADADLDAADIDVVFADGSGDVDLDLAESQAITAVFGPRAVPVTVPKTLTGRLFAGGGALDVVTALLAIRHQTIPATFNVRSLADDSIDLVMDRPRAATVRSALVLARGHGGFHSALVLRRYAGAHR